MGIPDPSLESYLVSSARQRAAELLASFAADHAPADDTELLCARVGLVFDDYCAGLLDALRNAVLPVEAAESRWVRDHYVPLMIEFATALRDSVADSKARHAAAQLIQCRVLEHERELRIVVESSTAHAAEELASAVPASESPAVNAPLKNSL